MNDPQLLMVLVDALRYDQVTEKLTPFLWEAGRSGCRAATKEIFAGQLRSAFFAGLYPNESGVGHLFCYDPENSPFGFARHLPGFLDQVPRLSYWTRRFVHTGAKAREAAKGHRGSTSYCYLAEIPLDRLPFFAFSEKTLPWEKDAFPTRGLLQTLSDNRIPWLHLGYPVVDQRTYELTNAALTRIREPYRFLFLHYAELDWAGHTSGPFSQEALKALAKIDSALKQIWDRVCSIWKNPQLLVFGDHGMVEITSRVDLLKALEELPLKHGKDYVVFLDSTVARFWFLRPRARETIIDRLEKLNGGRWLFAEDKKELHLDGAPRENGEDSVCIQAQSLL